MTQEKFEKLYEEYGDDFTEWIENQDLNDREQRIWRFHYWMREETELASGSIVDYRKYVAQYLDGNGELDAPDGLGSHERAAVNKFRDFSKKTGDCE